MVLLGSGVVLSWVVVVYDGIGYYWCNFCNGIGQFQAMMLWVVVAVVTGSLCVFQVVVMGGSDGGVLGKGGGNKEQLQWRWWFFKKWLYVVVEVVLWVGVMEGKGSGLGSVGK